MKIVDEKNIQLDNKDVIQAVMDYCKKTFPMMKYKDLSNIMAKSGDPLQSLNSPEFSITIYLNKVYEKKKSRFTIPEKLRIINLVFKRIENIGKNKDKDKFDLF